jgi:hypothetical protein
MMKTRIYLLLFVFLTISPEARAQSPFDSWVQSQINNILDKQNVGQNGKGADRQKESPSADPRSTSLVDQSSATDFFSVAANLVPVAPGLTQTSSGTASTSNNSTTGSTTATASLYSLLAALNNTNPTDPAFYGSHVFSRRLSFTIGSSASDQATDNTTTPATVYGAKFLVINHRELYTKSNLNALKNVQKAVSDAAAASAALKAKIKELIFLTLHPNDADSHGAPDPDKFLTFNQTELSDANLQTTINSLPADTKNKIQSLMENAINSFSAERSALQSTYDQISKGMQMSFSYTADIRDAKGNNTHRGEFAFDYGISDRINWTFNASSDYTDRKMATDSKGGRVATAFLGNLTKSNAAWGRSPIQLSFSGEAQWLTSQKPQYTFQAKLSIPLTSGIDLPVVYQYANRAAQINQSNSEARLGLSIDLSRLVQTFKQQ